MNWGPFLLFSSRALFYFYWLVGPVPLKSPASLPLSSAGDAGRSGKGRGVCACTVVVLGMFGCMPLWSLSPVPAGGVRWPASSSYCWFPWWNMVVGGGSSRCSSNKLADEPDRCPDLEDLHSFVLNFSRYHGGGWKVQDELSSGSNRWGWSYSPVVLAMRLRRLLAAGLLRLAIGSSSRRAAFFFLLAMLPNGRQCSYGSESVVSPPADAGDSAMEAAAVQVVRPRCRRRCICSVAAFGPNCDLVSQMGVLFVKVRDWLVVSLFLESFCALCTAFCVTLIK
jgi:hypothetical protein